MKLAFARLFGGEDTYDAVLDKSGITETLTEEDVAFSDAVLSGIETHQEEIDPLISELAIGWSIERMLYRRDIPYSVSINEAVELAKRFGGERSSAYINGMLGTLAKRLEAENGEQQ